MAGLQRSARVGEPRQARSRARLDHRASRRAPAWRRAVLAEAPRACSQRLFQAARLASICAPWASGARRPRAGRSRADALDVAAAARCSSICVTVAGVSRAARELPGGQLAALVSSISSSNWAWLSSPAQVRVAPAQAAEARTRAGTAPSSSARRSRSARRSGRRSAGAPSPLLAPSGSAPPPRWPLAAAAGARRAAAPRTGSARARRSRATTSRRCRTRRPVLAMAARSRAAAPPRARPCRSPRRCAAATFSWGVASES